MRIKTKIGLAVSLLSIVPVANSYEHKALRVEKTQVIDSKTGNSERQYLIDGLEIVLSEKDKRLASNWNLSDGDWAKYKYIIEYTPRGTWTPDLDPPIVLGNYATTQAERMHYAKIMNELELARRDRELAFQEAAIKAIYQKEPSTNPNIKKPNTGLASQLSDNRDTLRSLFIDLEACDADCKIFSTLAIATSPSTTKLDIHFTRATAAQAESFLKEIGVTDERKKSKAISVNASLNNDLVEMYRGGGKVPYYIIKTDADSKRIHIN